MYEGLVAFVLLVLLPLLYHRLSDWLEEEERKKKRARLERE
jgi:hypothetical protein